MLKNVFEQRSLPSLGGRNRHILSVAIICGPSFSSSMDLPHQPDAHGCNSTGLDPYMPSNVVALYSNGSLPKLVVAEKKWKSFNQMIYVQLQIHLQSPRLPRERHAKQRFLVDDD